MSGWDGHLVDPGPGPMHERISRFLGAQIAGWPMLANAVEALSRVKTRQLRVGDRTVTVQWNPGRATSSTAKVDAATIGARPCFLCPQNHPPEEKGFAFGDDLVALPNPAPILPSHLVIAHRDHRPQDVGAGLAGLLDFAIAAGPSTTALYNGPRSGASAPDHLHLQGVAAGILPEEVFVREALSSGRVPGDTIARSDGFLAWSAVGAGREILGLTGRRDRVEDAVRTAVSELTTGPEEPQLNLVATTIGPGSQPGTDDDALVVLLFPRGAHRPASFFDGTCVVSPGVIDMAGLVVTVREQDFLAIDGPTVEGIFREVTLPPERWAAVRASLGRRWSDG